MFQESFHNGILLTSLTGAQMTLLPKPGKPNNKCENFRPISLLNVDLKILNKILARRLEKIIPDVIDKDQNGLVQGRQGFINVQRLLNCYMRKNGQQIQHYCDEMLRKLPTELNGPIYLRSLQALVLEKNKLMKLLYSEPYAEIMTDRILSKTRYKEVVDKEILCLNFY